MTIKVLLDIDPGLDDALALDYALTRSGLQVLAVTSTFGAVPVMQATHNALRLCHAAGRADVPVCVGMAAPLRKPVMHHDPALHGHDGLGGLVDLQQLDAASAGADERSAARCIAEMARAHPGELCVVTGGPLGNLLQALRLEPRLPTLLKSVVVAGGALGAAGNVSPVAEYNFWQDPHAADEVATAGLNLTLLGLDAIPLGPQAQAREGRQHEPLLSWAQSQAGLNQKLWRHALPALGAHGSFQLLTLMALRLLEQPGLFPTRLGRLRVVTDGIAQGQSILNHPSETQYPQSGWEAGLPEVAMVCGPAQSPLFG